MRDTSPPPHTHAHTQLFKRHTSVSVLQRPHSPSRRAHHSTLTACHHHCLSPPTACHHRSSPPTVCHHHHLGITHALPSPRLTTTHSVTSPLSITHRVPSPPTTTRIVPWHLITTHSKIKRKLLNGVIVIPNQHEGKHINQRTNERANKRTS